MSSAIANRDGHRQPAAASLDGNLESRVACERRDREGFRRSHRRSDRRRHLDARYWQARGDRVVGHQPNPVGAEVRKRADGEWEFRDLDSGKWKIATGPKSQLAKPLVPLLFEGKRYNQRRDTWRLNDFGEMGWRIQGTDGQFIHTTPEDEETALAGRSPELAASHGCVHLDPGGRSRLRERGYLQEGVKFIVRSYTVHLLPEAMRQIMQGDKPLHDKPSP